MEECVICKIDRSRIAELDECFMSCQCNFTEKLHKFKCCGKMYHSQCLETYLLEDRKQSNSVTKKNTNQTVDTNLESQYINRCPHCRQECKEDMVNNKENTPEASAFWPIVGFFLLGLVPIILGVSIAFTLDCDKSPQSQYMFPVCNKTFQDEYDLESYYIMNRSGGFRIFILVLYVNVLIYVYHDPKENLPCKKPKQKSLSKASIGFLSIYCASKIVYLIFLIYYYTIYLKIRDIKATDNYDIDKLVSEYKSMTIFNFCLPEMAFLVLFAIYVILYGIYWGFEYSRKQLQENPNNNRGFTNPIQKNDQLETV